MTVTDVTASAYKIPTDQPEADGTLAWDATTMVLATVTDGDHQGLGWTYAGTGAVAVITEHLAPVVTDADTAEIPRLVVRRGSRCGYSGQLSGRASVQAVMSPR